MTEKYTIEIDREVDGRFSAEVTNVPGVLVYGRTRLDALHRVVELLEDVLEYDWAEQVAAQEAEVALAWLAANLPEGLRARLAHVIQQPARAERGGE